MAMLREGLFRRITVTTAALAFSFCGAYAQQGGAAAQANGVSVQHGRVVITKDHTTMMLEPYAPN
ncbi:MAG: hypothetical protein ACRD22_04060, partial [Terriglobia bacterium]